jgi:di/tricarboxylate transporter
MTNMSTPIKLAVSLMVVAALVATRFSNVSDEAGMIPLLSGSPDEYSRFVCSRFSSEIRSLRLFTFCCLFE